MSQRISQSAGLQGADYSLSQLLALRFDALRVPLKSGLSRRSTIAGTHYSRIRGRGMSFAESRFYQPGDDVRLIDWRVTARSGTPHTKVFEEEKERPVFVLADFGSSMRFGTHGAFKHVVAAELCGLIGWSALESGDRIGALLAASEGHVELKPVAGRRAVMRLLHALESVAKGNPAQRVSSLAEALQRAAHVVHPGSLIFLVSDFYHLDEQCERHIRRLRLHNDLVMCQILDRLELSAPPAGDYPVSDGRHLGRLGLRSRRSRQDFEEVSLRRREKVAGLARRHRITHGVISAGSSVAGQLRTILG